jgi:hypothetical protein
MLSREDSIQNKEGNIDTVINNKQYLSHDFVVSKESLDKIKLLPEMYTSSKNTEFHNIFFEKYLKYDNKKYSPAKYYGVFSDLVSNGSIVNDSNRCRLLYDWVDCYNSNHKYTMTSERIAYIFDHKKCSVKIY